MKQLHQLQAEREELQKELDKVNYLMDIAIQKEYDFTQLFRTVNDLKAQLDKNAAEMQACGGTKDPGLMTTHQAILSTASVRRKIPAELGLSYPPHGPAGTSTGTTK